jgi:transposase
MQKRVLEAQARVGRLEAALTEAVDAWCFAPLVRNLQVLRGISEDQRAIGTPFVG